MAFPTAVNDQITDELVQTATSAGLERDTARRVVETILDHLASREVLLKDPGNSGGTLGQAPAGAPAAGAAATGTQRADAEGYVPGITRGLLQFIHMCALRLPGDAYSQNIVSVFNNKLSSTVGSWTFGQISDEDCSNAVTAALQECQSYDGT
ncbi:hypothetical protein OV203_35795 [Nannocystis sp. ILAH1]|uniref:hypothetical protein n=1 Tax=Nannocystis sp. ILAH1 TaxID=2996789 RepID=UPI00226F3E7B|nr:hypothetical protein [Nannocystis sp. ILAH1]MCY0992558.1 hypothetical protein [Nannocystis sp. ILAH1]